MNHILYFSKLTEPQPSLDLPAERAALREAGETTCRLAQHHVAVPAEHHRLRVAVDRGDLQTSRALHIHEEAVRRLDHALQLVLRLLLLRVGMQQVAIHRFTFDSRRSFTGADHRTTRLE